MRFGAGIILVPGVIADLGRIITKEPLGGTPCATGVFPLRLGGKPGFYIGDLTEPNTELLGIRFRDVIDRTIRSLGGATRVLTHGRHVLRLGHLVFTEVKALGKFHPMLGDFHAGETAFLLVLAAHDELAGFHINKLHGHPVAEV